MAKEYIEREALLNKIWYGNGDSIVLRNYASEKVKDAPTADVVEVRHGEWETTDTPLGRCCICSICGSCPTMEYRYCPYCGAKMDGKGDQE